MIHGVGDGKFNPNGQMSRAEAAQVFANLLHLSNAADISAYVDVPANLEPGDILFQGINGKSIYYVGVYLGEGKLLMRQYNKDTALQETVLYDFTTTDNFADILKTGPGLR